MPDRHGPLASGDPRPLDGRFEASVPTLFEYLRAAGGKVDEKTYGRVALTFE